MVDKHSKNLVKNSFILGLGIIIPKFLGIIILPLLTSYLNTSEYGEYDLIISITSLIIPIISLQIQQGIFRFLLTSKNEIQKKSYILTSFIFIIISTIITSPISFIICKLLNLSNTLSIIVCLLIVCESIYILLGQVMRGLGQNFKYSIATITYAVFNIILTVTFVKILSYGLFGVVLSICLSYFFSFVFLMYNVFKRFKFSLKNINFKSMKELCKFSIPIIPSSISLWVVNFSSRIIIVYFLSAEANGLYAVATKIPSIYMVAYNVFNLSWTETAVRVADENVDKCEYYSLLFNKLFVFLVGSLILIISMTPLFYKIFVNEAYFEAYNQTGILYYGVFFNSIICFFSGIYIALNKTKQVGYSSIGGAVINIIINLLLIKYIGLYASSISNILSYLTIVIYRANDIKKYVDMKYNYRNIITGITCLVVCSIFYYIKNIYCFIIIFIISLIYNLYYNKYILIWFINKIKIVKIFKNKKM